MDLLNGKLDWNESCLCDLCVSQKAGVLALRLTQSLILSLVDIFFASMLIEASSLGGAFQ